MDLLGDGIVTILTSTSDIIRVVTGSAVSNIEVQASYTDLNGSTYTPGSAETEITTATTTTVVSAPGASTSRRIKNITIRNNSSSSCQVTVQKYNGTIAADLMGVTLLAGETLSRCDEGEWRHYTSFGAYYSYSPPAPGNLGISGAKAENYPRELCPEANLSALTSGTLALQAIQLYKGMVINSISVCSATTAAGTPTNQIFGIYDKRYQLCATTTNDTTTAWAANTVKTLSLTSAYTVPVTDIYFIGVMVAATTVPTLKGITVSTVLPGQPFPPFLGGASATGLTTALPNPCGQITTHASNRYWACVS